MTQGRSAGVSFYAQLDKVKEGLEKVLPIFMGKVAGEVVRLSPVLSGDYVNSHVIGTGSAGGGRFTSNYSRNRATASEQGERSAALANLMSQIGGLSKTTARVTLSNSVPHAYKVEYAGWASKPPYAVYSITKSRAPTLLQEAITEAGLK